ncbi:hypothetical protein A5482_003760 [Cyanobacterium sp. IPPAS B-1200]|uniref:hypothetical protein n=1 Tax=Cyanobacterium sp. IPPAS B-1200 TaxID=1562720 RepID=UPI0008526F24|nr:hypothetical protein [Cyanobacterium sp. IPPAS B-1200]OEJ78279.1 hypothetical protein A5482_03320 [Cyanobacterium sp. IPPAS B-1200]
MNNDSDKNIEKPWWNRPLWGDRTMVEKLESIIHKDQEKIPDEVIKHHEQVMSELKILTPIGRALDNPKFIEPEFVTFFNITNLFAQEIGEYKGLRNYVALFRVAIEAQSTFLKIEQIELSHRSSKQQELYQFVLNKLEQKINAEEFIEALNAEKELILTGIKTEEGKFAVNSYVETLTAAARQDELALKLLYLFKKYNLEDFSLLKTVSDMIDYLLTKNLQNFEEIVSFVKINGEKFIKLSNIIEIPAENTNDEDFARMFQYIALKRKYQDLYVQFQRLLELLTLWNSFYETAKDIRSHYPLTEFDHPAEFEKPIPGEDLYFRYKNIINQLKK